MAHDQTFAPVAITGMHRSGTSMITRALHDSGLHLIGSEASELIDAAEDNPEGFWENKAIVACNDELLEATGGSWDNPPDFPPHAVDDPRVADIAAASTAAITALNVHDHWGFKDPRVCLTAAYWLDLVPDLRFIVCVRHPLEVALSLKRRNQNSYSLGLALWERYYATVLDLLPPERVLVTHYDTFFTDPAGEIARLCAFADLTPAPPRVRTDLRHHTIGVGLADAGASPSLPRAVRAPVPRSGRTGRTGPRLGRRSGAAPRARRRGRGPPRRTTPGRDRSPRGTRGGVAGRARGRPGSAPGDEPRAARTHQRDGERASSADPRSRSMGRNRAQGGGRRPARTADDQRDGRSYGEGHRRDRRSHPQDRDPTRDRDRPRRGWAYQEGGPPVEHQGGARHPQVRHPSGTARRPHGTSHRRTGRARVGEAIAAARPAPDASGPQSGARRYQRARPDRRARRAQTRAAGARRREATAGSRATDAPAHAHPVPRRPQGSGPSGKEGDTTTPAARAAVRDARVARRGTASGPPRARRGRAQTQGRARAERPRAAALEGAVRGNGRGGRSRRRALARRHARQSQGGTRRACHACHVVPRHAQGRAVRRRSVAHCPPGGAALRRASVPCSPGGLGSVVPAASRVA